MGKVPVDRERFTMVVIIVSPACTSQKASIQICKGLFADNRAIIGNLYSVKIDCLFGFVHMQLVTIFSRIIVIIIIPEQFIKSRKWWFGQPHQGRFDILTMMDRECSRLDPSYQRNITFACTGCYQLHPHHRLGIITPELSPVPIYQPRKDG